MMSLVNAEAGAQRQPPRARFWPGFVIALIACQLAVGVFTVYLAVSEPTFAVEPDYYANAVKWDEHAAMQRQNRALGWKVELSVSALESAPGERMLVCIVRDRDGAPLRDAGIDLVAFSHARATDRQSLALTRDAYGAYSAALRAHATGLWEFRIAVRRGATTFTAVERLEIAPAMGRRP